ncbi:MAG TPA: hypothetical protein VMR33_12630 [Candidatus Baltobacteraceae bacterium]|jgi:hypothetical protein|nr:hypothetical protein [Candidatus Baltobacteraceae bacterium]
MKIQPTSRNVETPPLTAVIIGKPTERPPEAAQAAHSDLRVKPDDSAQFREDILRRYDAPLAPSWLHGGLNE